MADNDYGDLKPLASLKDLTMDGIARPVGDLTEDAWEFAAPPPHDLYQVKFYLAKDAWKHGLENPKDPTSLYLQASLECRTVSENPDYDNVPVFMRVSTRLYRAKEVSTMEGLIVKFGYAEALQKKGTLTPKLIGTFLEATLKKEPILWCELDWRGSYSYIPRNSKDGLEVWENVFNHYHEFPNDDNQGKRHIVSVPGKDALPKEIRAQLYIAKLYGKNEEAPKPGTLGLVSAPKGPRLATPVLASPVLASPTLAPPTAPPVQRTNAAPVAAADDTELLLEG